MLAKTFGQRPSTIARDLLRDEIPSYVSARDWYIFDVTATGIYYEMRDLAQSDDIPKHLPQRVQPRATVQRESGQLLHLVGSEVPPWQR